MKKSWWYLYGIVARLNLGIVLIITLLLLTNRINLLGIQVFILAHSGLCLLAIKARLPLLKIHRLLGMSIIDAFYEYLKASIFALFISFFLLVMAYQLTWISQVPAKMIAFSLIAIYVLSLPPIYIMLRRSL